MKRLTKPLLMLACSLCLAASPLKAQELLITGDVRGHFLASDGDDRPGALGLVSQPGDALRLDAGNLLFSRHLIEQPLPVLLAAPELLGYDLLHITWLDLVHGADTLRSGLDGRSYQAVSANLVHRGDGELLVPAYAIFEHGGRRIAVTGVSGLGSQYLDQPEFERVLAEVEFLDPVTALRSLLPKLRREADDIVVLFAGDNASLFRLAGELGNRIDLLVVGYTPGLMNEPLPAGVANGRGTFGFRALQAQRSDRPVRRGASPWQRILVNASPGMEDAAIAAELEAMGISRAPALDSAFRRGEVVAEALPPETRVDVQLSARSRAHGLSVSGITRTRTLGDFSAPDGKEFLILEVTAENRKPADLISLDRGQQAILFGHLDEVMVLVKNRAQVIALHPDHGDLPGTLPVTFTLPSPGTTRSGRLIYRVPSGDWDSLELRHHHIEYEALSFPLLGEPQDGRSMLPAEIAQENNFFALAASDFEAIELEDQPDRQRVSLRLQGLSRLVRPNPAVHYRPDAAADETIDTARVVPFRHARDHVFLVNEEGFVYPPRWELGTLSDEPYFLPDLVTGGTLVFDLPADVDRFRLSVHFPNMATATDRQGGFPPAMHFNWPGVEFGYREVAPIIDFGLEQLRVVVTELIRLDESIVVEIEVFNETPNPGFWPMERRLSLTQAGGRNAIHATSMTDPYGFDLPWRAHLPPAEPRRMRLHFPVPSGDGAGQLSINGVSSHGTAAIRWTGEAVYPD